MQPLHLCSENIIKNNAGKAAKDGSEKGVGLREPNTRSLKVGTSTKMVGRCGIMGECSALVKDEWE